MRSGLFDMTDAEREVYKLVGLGLTNDEIAERLFISTLTVRTHVKRVHAKLDIEGRARLAIASYKENWAEPNKFAGAIEILKTRHAPEQISEAIRVLEDAGR